MGLLLCGLINVSIASAKLAQYSFKVTKTNPNPNIWVSRGLPSISVGTEIEFRVERFGPSLSNVVALVSAKMYVSMHVCVRACVRA